MAIDEQQPGQGSDEEPEVEELDLAAPSKGSAEELLDATAARPPRPDAPQRGPRHGRGGDGPVPGHQARHRPRHRRWLLLRLPRCPARSRPPTSRPSRRACAERQGRSPVASASSSRSTRLARVAGDGQDFKVEILDDLHARPKARCSRYRHDDLLRARPVPRPVPGPPCREHRASSARSSCSPCRARTGGATSPPVLQRIYGTVWGDRGGTRPVPGGAEPRRRSATTGGWASSSTSIVRRLGPRSI